MKPEPVIGRKPGGSRRNRPAIRGPRAPSTAAPRCRCRPLAAARHSGSTGRRAAHPCQHDGDAGGAQRLDDGADLVEQLRVLVPGPPVGPSQPVHHRVLDAESAQRVIHQRQQPIRPRSTSPSKSTQRTHSSKAPRASSADPSAIFKARRCARVGQRPALRCCRVASWSARGRHLAKRKTCRDEGVDCAGWAARLASAHRPLESVDLADGPIARRPFPFVRPRPWCRLPHDDSRRNDQRSRGAGAAESHTPNTTPTSVAVGVVGTAMESVSRLGSATRRC